MANKQLLIKEDVQPGFSKINQVRNGIPLSVTEFNATHIHGIATIDTKESLDKLDTSLLDNEAIILVRETSTYYKLDKESRLWSLTTSGGQFVDEGTSIGSGVAYTAAKSAQNEDIVVKAGMNAFSVDSFELDIGTTLTIEADATYKIL